MISLQDAVAFATEHLKAIIPTAQNILVEELEISDDDKDLFITLSFTDPTRMPLTSLGLGEILRPQNRVYRIIRLSRETGAVRSIRIRETAGV